MTSHDGERGYGPDDMGDDEQETEVGEYEQYIEDPPEDMVISEDADDDAEADLDWAARHPREAATQDEEGYGAAAEDAAIRERRNP